MMSSDAQDENPGKRERDMVIRTVRAMIGAERARIQDAEHTLGQLLDEDLPRLRGALAVLDRLEASLTRCFADEDIPF